MLRISAFGPNFVFRTNFVFATEFRLQRAPNRISSSHEFRLQGRFSSSNFVFAHNLSFSSWRTISSSKASEFRLQGGDETGTQFPGSMYIYIYIYIYTLVFLRGICFLCIHVYVYIHYIHMQIYIMCLCVCLHAFMSGNYTYIPAYIRMYS